MSDLPPLDQPQAYVVIGPDDQRGPYTMELLVSEVVAGRLDENTPVWWPGLADWTTMSAHPGVAAEVARRRGAPAQPAPMAFAPPTAPPPPQQQPSEGMSPSVGQEPAGAEPQADEPQVHQPHVAQPYVDQSQVGPPQADQPDLGQLQQSESQTYQEQRTEPFTGESTPEDAIEVPAVDVTAADFEAADEPPEQDGFRAAGAGEGIDPTYADAFSDLIRRSRARADAASIIQNVDSALVDAVDSAARDEGFEGTARSDAGELHDLSYVSPEGVSLLVHLGKVHGRDLAAGDAEVPLSVSVSASSYSGELDSGTGRHGEVVVVAVESGTGASAVVELILGLADYVDASYEVDVESLERDARSVIATLVHRIRG